MDTPKDAKEAPKPAPAPKEQPKPVVPAPVPAPAPTPAKKKSEVVISDNWTCRVCGATDCESIAKLPSTDHAGILGDGTKYTSVVRDRVRCSDCGAATNRNAYRFDPDQWVGGDK